jgi:hypothetical protein
MAKIIPTAAREALQIALMGGNDSLSPDAISAQRRLGNAQMAEGASGAPVQHWTQGANRALQGIVGGMREGHSRAQEQKAAELRKQSLAKALQGGNIQDSAVMLMGSPATSDIGVKLASQL